MLKKLRIKFICIIMAISALMMGIIFGLVLHFTRTDLEEAAQQVITSAIPDHGPRPELPPDQSRLPYFVLTQTGSLLSYRGSIHPDLYDEGTLQSFWQSASQTQSGVLEGHALQFQVFRTRDGLTGVVFVDISEQRATMAGLIRRSILIGAASLLLLFGVSILLSRWAVQPVAKAWEQQRQFVADASHELKTPLTVILTNGELLQNPACSEPDRVRFTDNILTMAHQMRGLVEGLLELARVDNGAVCAAFQTMDISSLLSDWLLPFEPVYFERGMMLEAQLEEEVPLTGSPAHIRQVVEILLDNALKYATAGSTVRVGLKKQGGHCLMWVASQGDPISRADLTNIFKRFYRVDKARTMDHSYGLGLSIAQSIVSSHRGKIWAESQSGVNTFFVQLPLSQK